ncbi:hypothetical protein TSUD_284380 [Trifolium subterraneum]|uniref:Uncharacterized protein n=1 Tax=Trifolium subterraneum TaxID=3900 RepID=A0A2Z6N894_TRISU|nr:hypothetical protein TSUD_284380 [Trifolium subterraneum]
MKGSFGVMYGVAAVWFRVYWIQLWNYAKVHRSRRFMHKWRFMLFVCVYWVLNMKGSFDAMDGVAVVWFSLESTGLNLA